MGKILVLVRIFIIILLLVVFVFSYSIYTLFFTHTASSGFRLKRRWTRLASIVLGLNIEVSGLIDTDNKSVTNSAIDLPHPALYVSNHRGFLDPIVSAIFVDTFFIAKAELNDVPIFGKGAAYSGIIWVNREKASSRKLTRIKTAELLSQGQNVLVYAEGTTGAQRTTLPFKPGTFKIAAELDIPIVPMVIEYREKDDLWDQESMTKQMFRQLCHWKTYVKFHVGSPIRNDDPIELCHETKNYIDEQLQLMQNNWSRAFASLKEENCEV